MKKYISFPLACIFISFLYSLTHLPQINQITAKTLEDALSLFKSLFFLIFLFSIANQIGFFQKLADYLYPIFKTFLPLTKQELSIYIASIFSGYPTYAKLISDQPYYSKRLIQFCSHPSIGYVVLKTGKDIFNDLSIGYLLFFIQVFTNFLIALSQKTIKDKLNKDIYFKPLTISLIKQNLKTSFEAFIYIYGFMLVFRIFIELLPIKNIFIVGLLEFSAGCELLVSYSKQVAFILCSFFLSFSSLSVICQALCFLSEEVSFKELLFARLKQAFISSFISLFISFLIF